MIDPLVEKVSRVLGDRLGGARRRGGGGGGRGGVPASAVYPPPHCSQDPPADLVLDRVVAEQRQVCRPGARGDPGPDGGGLADHPFRRPAIPYWFLAGF